MVQDGNVPNLGESGANQTVSDWGTPLGTSRALSTQKEYSRQWNLWTEWARSNGCSALPAHPASVAAYLSYRVSSGASPSTVKSARSAIRAHHKDAGKSDPTTGECIKRLVARLASDVTERKNDSIASTKDHAGDSRRNLCNEDGNGHQLALATSGAAKGSKRFGRSDFLDRLRPGQEPAYATDWGEAWVGDSRKLLKNIHDESIDLVVTSPPYGLLKKKEYGNEDQHDYVKWFRPFARELHRVLKPNGSLVINIGGAWQKGQPTRSLYPYRLMLDLCEPDRRRKSAPAFHLAQEFYWFNPAKLPNPVQWANVTRERVKDAVEPVWWLSKDPHPKACNRRVLVPYSEHMRRLLKSGKYNSGARPSGWNISKVWARDNGGAIPSNFVTDDALDHVFNLLVVSNTSSNDPLRKSVKEKGGNAHPAMFPTALPEFFIRMLTDEGDTVLDPFAGSNSTGWVADGLQRRWIAIDLGKSYVDDSRLRWPPPPSSS